MVAPECIYRCGRVSSTKWTIYLQVIFRIFSCPLVSIALVLLFIYWRLFTYIINITQREKPSRQEE
ncbi:hypothetical protein BDV38DRAFT_261347 [Aspergillus pseudotamarii]|uniref:Uncharacterized protein n=1 Tax=Aspergillus pseudotamarii TaxID=132259 RepID=A0A5N6SH25_ASPPS|nr:uncharacterized protein BDV38DRAFT_261347 [Aspergillus pseudotamarii]KAE8132404.1 hypothetical protein BDV38DRAFT_261347 [Aspergillus pseudotamarii]